MSIKFTNEREEVVADLSDRWSSRIAIYFSYSREDVASVKRVPGAKFVGKGDLEPDEAPYWTVPKDMMSARALREEFGDRLQLTSRLTEWGWTAKRQHSMLDSLASADDAELHTVPSRLPLIAEAARGYQRAGIRFIGESSGALIADQPGLGKTLQSIAGVAESGLMEGDGRAYLVIAPSTSLEVTWLKELNKWQPFDVFVAVGGRRDRQAVIEEFEAAVEFGGNAWLVVNPKMVALETDYDTTNCIEHDDSNTNTERKDCAYCVTVEKRTYPEFEELSFDAIVIDESHQSIRNPRSLTSKGIRNLNLRDGGKKIAMTGTPIENRPIDLWSVLNWLDPESHSSKWRWAERFCEVSDNGYGKVIGDLRDDTQEEFFESLKPYVLRRTKREVAPELPPKNHIPIYLGFADSVHEKQYRQFQAEAYLKIADMELSATGVLDELTRLRQFAIAHCDVTENPKGDGHPIVVQQTTRSAKVEWLDEHLEELGILHDGKPNGGDEKIVVFSQFVSVVKMLKEHYEAKGCRVGEVSGRVSMNNRREQVAEFQDTTSSMKIMLVSTTAGGVSIELDAADVVVFMDETWNYSQMEQAEDRVHRANKGRTKQVNIYILRTEDTVETDVVMPKVVNKKAISEFILDVRRGVNRS